MSRKLGVVEGVGVNDADYQVQKFASQRMSDGRYKNKLVWYCHYYQSWVNIMKRGYNKKFKAKRPSYEDVSVCEEWHLFSTFKAWMETQDWEGKQLDKDLLYPGNRVYCPDKCVFISASINSFIVRKRVSKGGYLLGASWHKASGKFIANCNNPITNKFEHLGLFDNELDAHLAWVNRKHEIAVQLAATQDDARIASALKAYYSGPILMEKEALEKENKRFFKVLKENGLMTNKLLTGDKQND